MGDELKSRKTEPEEDGGRAEEAGAAKPWGIFIVDDHPVFRRGLRVSLEGEEFTVVGEAANGHEAVDAVKALTPDLVLMDVEMPGMTGLEALQRIKAETPEVAVVMLTAFPNENYLIQAAVSGASGFVLKSDNPKTFRQTLLDVLQGERAPDHRWWKAALAHVRDCAPLDRRGSAAPPAALTPKELAVLRHFARGRSSADVADREQVQGATLRKHCSQIYRKLHVSDRLQAVLMGIREGWLSAADPADTDLSAGGPPSRSR